MDDDAIRAWEQTVPDEFRADVLWTSVAYRLALYAGDLAIADAQSCRVTGPQALLGEQLLRSALSISTNIAEGYGRSGSRDRCRFFEYALGSAREGRDWYYKARCVVAPERVQSAIRLLTRITQLLLVIIRNERKREAAGDGAPAVLRRSGSTM